MKEYIKRHFGIHEAVLRSMQGNEYYEIIQEIAEKIIFCFENGGKLLICGNGGSAADAQHIAAEFVVRFEKARQALPAIALNANSSSITAIGNDFSANRIFERQIEAFGTNKDLLLAISTSGNSENIYLAVKKAKELEMQIISFLGKGGGKCRGIANTEFIVPYSITSYIQEMHIMCAHIVCELVDKYYEDKNEKSNFF